MNRQNTCKNKVFKKGKKTAGGKAEHLEISTALPPPAVCHVQFMKLPVLDSNSLSACSQVNNLLKNRLIITEQVLIGHKNAHYSIKSHSIDGGISLFSNNRFGMNGKSQS